MTKTWRYGLALVALAAITVTLIAGCHGLVINPFTGQLVLVGCRDGKTVVLGNVNSIEDIFILMFTGVHFGEGSGDSSGVKTAGADFVSFWGTNQETEEFVYFEGTFQVTGATVTATGLVPAEMTSAQAGGDSVSFELTAQTGEDGQPDPDYLDGTITYVKDGETYEGELSLEPY